MNFARPFAVFVALALLTLTGAAEARSYPTLPWDGVQWDWPQAPERIVGVGDVHGDVEHLKLILRDRGLIDAEGRWIGGKTHLVIDGDISDRGPATRAVMDLLMRLEGEAETAGGKLHVLVGNHEAMIFQGSYGYASREDLRSFTDFFPRDLKELREIPRLREILPDHDDPRRLHSMEKEIVSFLSAFRGDSKYARWLREKNSMIRIGDTMFVHAGLGDWARGLDPGSLNRTIRAWNAFYQGRGPRPPLQTNWVMGYTDFNHGPNAIEGPLWTAIFSLELKENRGVILQDLEEILAEHRVRRVVVGHITTPDHQVILRHPRYGDRVIMTDTAISSGYANSRPSAIEIVGGKVTAHYPKIEVGGMSTLAECGGTFGRLFRKLTGKGA